MSRRRRLRTLGFVGLAVSGGLLLTLVIAWLARNWYDRILLADYITELRVRDLQEMIAVRERLGPVGTAMLTDGLATVRDPIKRGRMAVLLPTYDTNALLSEAIRATPGTHAGWEMAEALKGRMDVESRAIVQNVAENSTGDVLVVALRVLATVADDPRSLRIAETVLRDRAHSDDVRSAAINLLGNAAFFNDAPEAVEHLRPIVADPTDNLRVIAVIALQGVPGQGAESLLRELAANETDGNVRHFAAIILEQRERILSSGATPRPSGFQHAGK